VYHRKSSAESDEETGIKGLTMKFSKGEMVFITWDDIRTDLSTEERAVPLVTYSIGEVDESNRYFIRLKTGWYEDSEFPAIDSIVIPRGCIREKKVLT
jgi:hypothetical protein